MKSLSLSGSDWLLDAYWINQWRMREIALTISRPMLHSIPARVPGAVHEDLLAAGLISDWQAGSSAFECEWINNRDWCLRRQVRVPDDFAGRVSLEFDGLDYSGTIFIDNRVLGTFEGTHLRHRFEMPDVRPGQLFELSLMFDAAPSVYAQCGWTSHTRLFKPRFGYSWDWCSRVINVGIWQDVRLVSRGPVRLEHCRVLPRVDDDLKTGRVRMIGSLEGGPCRFRYDLLDPGGTSIARGEENVDGPDFDLNVTVPDVQTWWPATHGDQPLYQFKIEAIDSTGQVSDRLERTIGFKHVRWLQNAGAPAGADPYLCEINGAPIFLRGANWVPISPLYGAVTAAQYDCLLRQYRHMNANILRVWGGAILERPEFYEACDRLGILVWQEFPLSSSGLEDLPPADPATIDQMKRLATEFIERRCHHASHLLWCGGNELQKRVIIDGKEENVPIDENEPLIRALVPLAESLDPGKRFLITSSTGPRFYAHAHNYGKGLHHDVHGPWANLPLSTRYAYWNADDALLRSELGAPACASLHTLERFCDRRAINAAGKTTTSWREVLWPPKETNPAWMVPGGTWVPWDDVTREFGTMPDDPAQLDAMVKGSRYLQAESYRYAAETARRNHPHTGGFIIWMGHDLLHCASNNSVIEVDGSEKPAYDWLRLAYSPRHVSLQTSSISFPAGTRFEGRVWITDDDGWKASTSGGTSGSLKATLVDMEGRVLESVEQQIVLSGLSTEAARLDWSIPQLPHGLFAVLLSWKCGDAESTNGYLFSQQVEHPLAPLLALPAARLSAELEGEGKVRVRNEGHVAAIGVRLIRPGPLLAAPNHFILLPGESALVRYEMAERIAPRGPLQVECLNGPTLPLAG